MIALLVTAFLTGCAFSPPDCASGYERDGQGECQSLVDVQEAEEAEGNLEIAVYAETAGIVLADDCLGDVVLEVDAASIDGVLSCSFVGEIGATLGGEVFQGTISGMLDDAGVANGSLVLELGVFGVLESDWSGQRSEGQLEGSFVGTMNVEIGALEAEVDYSGSFDAES